MSRKPGEPCARCNDEPRVNGYSYGPACRRLMQRERARRLAAEKRREASLPRLKRDGCNCRNPSCNGLMCDSIRHITSQPLFTNKGRDLKNVRQKIEARR